MRRTLIATVAAGVAGAVLPVTPAHAYVVPAKPAFGGFSASSTATPLKIEVYEPTIPIPAEPQAEASFAYTHTEAATGPAAKGRASWLWPGGPVGEGFKTFVEMLGLPKELGQNGYPVQVNSETPGDQRSQADEPFPGTVMRTSSSPRTTVAKAGYSADGDVSENDPKSGDSGTPGAPGAPGAPGVPSLPGAPTLPVPGDLSQLGAAITGKQAAPADGSTGPAAGPKGSALPPQVTALADVGGMTSISRSTASSKLVRSTGVSRVTQVSLLSGLITADSVKIASTVTTNGKKAATDATARVVGLALAGNQFTVGRDGVQAAGRQTPIPGLPDDPAKALDKLGVSFVLPQGQRTIQGADGKLVLQGLQMVIDTRVLRSKLDGIPFDKIVDNVPDSAGQLKSLLGAAVHLSPKLVVTLGGAEAEASTVPAIALPDLGALAPPATAGGGAASGGAAISGGDVSSGGGLPGDAGAALGGTPAGSDPGTTVATRNAAAGLPPLASVPGALMVAGLLLASGLGWWLQKIGAFVIGGAGSCTHGLETGVPDLRKA